MITQNDFMKLQDARERALAENDTPYLVVANDKMSVGGDANKTEVKKHDYTIGFAFPKEWADKVGKENIRKEIGQYIIVDIEYKDVFLKPRKQMSVISALVELEPFFNKILDDGQVKDLAPEDIRDVLNTLNDEMQERLYNAVASILGVDKSLVDYMIITDVIITATRIYADFPEAVNEANAFFELSASRVHSKAER